MNKAVSAKEIWFWMGLLLVAALAVIIYNSWALCCGHCTWGDLLQIPWWGILLLGANLTGGLALVILRRKTTQAHENDCPGCRFTDGSRWSFCPVCGSQRVSE